MYAVEKSIRVPTDRDLRLAMRLMSIFHTDRVPASSILTSMIFHGTWDDMLRQVTRVGSSAVNFMGPKITHGLEHWEYGTPMLCCMEGLMLRRCDSQHSALTVY
jgi:hypothetical protein